VSILNVASISVRIYFSRDRILAGSSANKPTGESGALQRSYSLPLEASLAGITPVSGGLETVEGDTGIARVGSLQSLQETGSTAPVPDNKRKRQSAGERRMLYYNLIVALPLTYEICLHYTLTT